jgi:hypothetical protein
MLGCVGMSYNKSIGGGLGMRLEGLRRQLPITNYQLPITNYPGNKLILRY